MTEKPQHWYMLTLVGQDKPGIVAHVASALYEGGCYLGETSMLRMGGNFTIMMMVQISGSARDLQGMVGGVAESLDLYLHIDPIQARLHDHTRSDVRISVYGADSTGIVAKVTTAMAEAGLDIVDLESDVAGTEAAPLYVMHMEGHARQGVEALESALDIVRESGIQASLESIDTLIG